MLKANLLYGVTLFGPPVLFALHGNMSAGPTGRVTSALGRQLRIRAV
jgi:hypothetical protein